MKTCVREYFAQSHQSNETYSPVVNRDEKEDSFPIRHDVENFDAGGYEEDNHETSNFHADTELFRNLVTIADDATNELGLLNLRL